MLAARRFLPRRPLLVITLVALAAAGSLVALAFSARADLTVSGLSDGAVVAPAALREVAVTTGGDLDRVEVLLDDSAVPVRQEGDRLLLDVGEPAEGEHTLAVRLPAGVAPLPGSETVLDFTVDATPPALEIEPVEPVEPGEPGAVRGSARGADSVRAGSEPVAVADDGTFTVPVPPGTGRVTVEARDAAGNTAAEDVVLPVRHPGMRAVHMTAMAWASPALREPVLRLARENRIDTVQLDIKDESGEIGYASQVPLAQEIGAARGHYDARAALGQLHEAGLRVVGRVVAFRDPILAEASWHGGHRERVIQQADGTAWTGGYGEYAFTNFADPAVRGYNVALAAEAAELGFDEILYDYIRRPEGLLSQMRVPGLGTSPEEAIAGFLEQTRPALREHGALLGASVFGIAADRPELVAQDIPSMAEHADYIAPMVYPSHWGPGEYGVEDPERQPYQITARSLAAFARKVQGSPHTEVIPWLQAFSMQVRYGPREIQAQIKAAEDNGMDSFILWDPRCRYDPQALRPR
ncbi:putative glycoside hydrolase [Qaidamihabitans albus]|uniref:putative glycoside hydrolase n=1 Tax=Qaidamihabitans albus TaxID=2795733 RepID=UPI0018F14D39|nr:putative glycoside hydrolase [Qaidamihabitans albus]